ncbi:MmcQ/YjbR family DNA-binding protein [Inquilinus limosus]|uniref:MmcQ/YjbR family DNA-binding protein n=1 Tax=Inquilinus limosus TaxID=171674 RepID=UPI00041121F8|nr:MmcQ/YjbR family DNA-binding protein [Inquilinus limosus]
MTPEAVEAFCLSLPGATLSVQWGGAHVFKVGGKIFALLAGMSRGEPEAWFKASDFSHILLIEQPGIRPAPYLARAKWVAAALDALPEADLQAYLREAHRLILAKLTRAARAEILGPG